MMMTNGTWRRFRTWGIVGASLAAVTLTTTREARAHHEAFILYSLLDLPIAVAGVGTALVVTSEIISGKKTVAAQIAGYTVGTINVAACALGLALGTDLYSKTEDPRKYDYRAGYLALGVSQLAVGLADIGLSIALSLRSAEPNRKVFLVPTAALDIDRRPVAGLGLRFNL